MSSIGRGRDYNKSPYASDRPQTAQPTRTRAEQEAAAKALSEASSSPLPKRQLAQRPLPGSRQFCQQLLDFILELQKRKIPESGTFGETEIEDINQIHESLQEALELFEFYTMGDLSETAEDRPILLDLQQFFLKEQNKFQRIARIKGQKEKTKPLTINFALDKSLRLPVQAQYLRQIVTNLVSNSMKFSKEGATLTLGLNIVKEEENEVTLEFTLTDEGEGMTKEEMNKLFQIYQQANAGIKSQHGGTGLGLVTTAVFVKKMRGEIWPTDNVLGQKGTTMHFTMKVPKRASDEVLAYTKKRESQVFSGLPKKFKGMNQEKLAEFLHEFRGCLLGVRASGEFLKRSQSKALVEYGTFIDATCGQLNHVCNVGLDSMKLMAGKATLQRNPIELAQIAETFVEKYEQEIDRSAPIKITVLGSTKLKNDSSELALLFQRMLFVLGRDKPKSMTMDLTLIPQEETVKLQFLITSRTPMSKELVSAFKNYKIKPEGFPFEQVGLLAVDIAYIVHMVHFLKGSISLLELEKGGMAFRGYLTVDQGKTKELPKLKMPPKSEEERKLEALKKSKEGRQSLTVPTTPMLRSSPSAPPPPLTEPPPMEPLPSSSSSSSTSALPPVTSVKRVEEEKNKYSATRVLIADDVRVNQRLYSRMLRESTGITKVTAVGSGEEALKLLTENPSAFDLFVVDMQMKELSGSELVVMLKNSNDPILQRLPIIAILDRTLDSDHRARLAPFLEIGYMVKGDTVKDVAKQVEKTLG